MRDSNSEALSKWRRIETGFSMRSTLAIQTFRGIIQVKEDWNIIGVSGKPTAIGIPRHYPSEGGLKLYPSELPEIDFTNSEALSKWRRIETMRASCFPLRVQPFRGIIQVKEDWNYRVENELNPEIHIPRHYPSEGGLKLNIGVARHKQRAYSEALSKWRRIETQRRTPMKPEHLLFRGIIQVKEDWNRLKSLWL